MLRKWRVFVGDLHCDKEKSDVGIEDTDLDFQTMGSD